MNLFNLTRFSKLWRTHWAEYLRTYILFFVVCIGLYYIMALVAFATVGHDAFQTNAQMICFFGGLFVTGAVFAMRFYEGLSRKGAGLLILMRPASTFEKWLLAFVMLIVVYPLIYTLIYSLVNIPSVQLAKQIAMNDWKSSYAAVENETAMFDSNKYSLFIPFYPHNITDALTHNTLISIQKMLFLLFISTQAFVFAGSLYFKRLVMLKTVLIGFLLHLTYFSFLAITHSDPTPLVFYWMENTENYAEMYTSVKVATLLAWFATPALLWLACYFYLKQRETI